MIPKTIRWRLPLNYALIALLTTLALGAILLTTLRNFYAEQEQAYLSQNAATISNQITPILVERLPLPALESQVQGFAFLSQTRVRVLDMDGTAVLADSGPIGESADGITVSVEVEVDGVAQAFSQTVGDEQNGTTFRSTIIVEDGLFSQNVEETVYVNGNDTELEVNESLIARLPAVGTPYGFGLGNESTEEPRSNIVLRYPIDALGKGFLGYVELSQGPAYGRSALASVAWGWGIAGTIAVLLAAFVGWLMSRQLSQPLVQLTAVTSQMTNGDLSVRSPIERADELGSLSQSFNQMADRIEETVTTLREFVADAAHELHTPLTALRTNLEIVGQNITETEHAERISRAEAQVARLEKLTTGLLELSKIESGTAVSPHVPINFTDLVQSASELYASRAEQAGLSFVTHLDRPITIMGDAEQLRQAIGNLLDNAIKFTPAGGEVTVALRQENGTTQLQVSDTGIGIPEGDAGLLYGRFHRGRNAASYAGNGLGLAIVHAVVEGHNGRINIQKLTHGTKVSINLPSTQQS